MKAKLLSWAHTELPKGFESGSEVEVTGDLLLFFLSTGLNIKIERGKDDLLLIWFDTGRFNWR